MANETMTVNRLPALTWNWLKMNAARLEANAPAVGAAPSFVQTAQLARSSAAQDWAMETGMGTDVDRFLANSPAEYLTLGENEVMDAPAVITYTYQPGIPAGDRLYLEAKAGSTMKVAVILRNETAGEGLAALQIKIKAAAGAVVKLSMVQVLDNGFTCLSDIGTTCADGASFELTKLELGSGKLYAGAAADLIGKGSNFTARIGYLGQGEQRLDMNYVARHRGKKTTCEMDSTGVLAGKAFKLFRGSIDLLPGGSGAKGQEQENVLLLGDGVVNQTIPLILCGEEDVEGNHGATIGRLDEKMLFYLASRGIPEEAARERVRKFLNARSDAEIIFTRNTTESINLVAYSYALNNIHAGDEIVITIMEHHSNMLPWQMVARQTGAKLVYLECEKDGSLPDEKLEAVIGPKVKLAAIGHVSNVLGCVNPVEKVIELVHHNGGVVLVDAAQSAPHMKVDVQALDADFVAFSGHKLMAPMGIGVLYGKEKLLDAMPPFLTGGEMIDSVTRDGAVYAELPHKFEAGTVNAGGAVALAAAIDYLESIGLENVHAQEQALTRYAYEGMKKIPGVNILGSDDPDKHCGILSFTVDGVHPHDIATILDSCHVDVRAGHHCAQPLLAYLGVRSCARASLAFYNTTADIDRFLAALGGVRKEMGYAE